MGLKSGWHAAAVMGTTQVHAKRLAHACEMRLELLAQGAPSATRTLNPAEAVTGAMQAHAEGLARTSQPARCGWSCLLTMGPGSVRHLASLPA